MLCPCCFSTYSLHKKWLSSNPSKKQERVKINNISCNSLLSAFEKGRCWMDALHLFEKMRRWRLHTQVSKGAFHFGYHFKRNSNPPPVIAVDSTTLFAVDCLSIIHPSSPPSSYAPNPFLLLQRRGSTADSSDFSESPQNRSHPNFRAVRGSGFWQWSATNSSFTVSISNFQLTRHTQPQFWTFWGSLSKDREKKHEFRLFLNMILCRKLRF